MQVLRWIGGEKEAHPTTQTHTGREKDKLGANNNTGEGEWWKTQGRSKRQSLTIRVSSI